MESKKNSYKGYYNREKVYDTLPELIAYYQTVAEKKGLTKPLAKAKDKGGKRDAKKFDIFVHPFYPFQKGYLARNEGSQYTESQLVAWRQEYIQQLVAKLLEAANAIVINDYREKKWPELKGQKIIRSDRRVHDGGTGALTSYGVKKLFTTTQGIHPEDEYTIHGATWLHCPVIFARQLYLLTQHTAFQPHLITGGFIGWASEPCWENDKNFNRIFETEQLWRGSNIVAGIQYNCCHYITSPFRMQKEDQFHSETSLVIPSPQEVIAYRNERLASKETETK
jgi:hypothetical protein